MAGLKKIVFLITDCDFGGAEKMLYELCRGLNKSFPIQVLALKRKGHFGRMIEELGIPVKSYNLAPSLGLGYYFGLVSVFLRIRSDLVEMNPDIIQGILFQGNFFAKLAGRLAGIKNILCSLHTFDRGSAKVILEKLTNRMAQRYIVVSDALKVFCAEKFSIPLAKISVVRNGIQLEQFAPLGKELREKLGVKSEGPVIGAIGRLHREKGIDVLIRAFSRLASEMPGLSLLIIGDGPEKNSLEEMAKNSGIMDRIIFTGFLPEAEKYLPLFDLFILPSRIEAMPIALMQAMAAGKAIVATNVGAVSELVKDNESAMLVPPEDESLMSRAIAKLLRDPELSRKLGAAAKAKASSEFSLEKMIESYKKIYMDALEGKN
jgi:glycosyltransferase involved in cell wall biosynthesis